MSKKRLGSMSDVFVGPSDTTRDHANTINSKWGSKDNFFTGGRAIWDKISPKRRGKRRSSDASIISSYADRRDVGGVPAIGAGGGRSRKQRRGVPQIAASQIGPGRERVPNISGAGAASTTAPAIGSGSVEVGGRSRERSAPVLGGYAVAEGNSPGGASKRYRRTPRGILAQFGFRKLAPEEERELDLFLRRAHQAGHEVPYRQWMSWRASIMLDEITVMDLWNGPIGQDIQRRYGAMGQELDKPEAARTPGQVVQPEEETREAGVAPSTRPEGAEVVR